MKNKIYKFFRLYLRFHRLISLYHKFLIQKKIQQFSYQYVNFLHQVYPIHSQK